MGCYKYICHLLLEWIHQCIYRVTHTPYRCQMYQIIPPDIADINHDRPSYLTTLGLVLFGRRFCHTRASRWAASHDAKVQPADGIAVANIEVQPPRYVGQMYESARCMRMLMVRCHPRLGLADMASDRSSIPPGAVGSTDRRQHDRNGTRCVAHDDAGRMQRNKACG